MSYLAFRWQSSESIVMSRPNKSVLISYLVFSLTLIIIPFFSIITYKITHQNWYISSIEDPKASIRSLLLIVPALFFLVCSTCVASVLPPGAITDTYSFHFSHYYILFATEVMIAVSGIMPINSFCNPVKILLPFEMHDVSLLFTKIGNLHISKIIPNESFSAS